MSQPKYIRRFALYDGETLLATFAFVGGANEKIFKAIAEAEMLRVEPLEC